MVVEEGVGNTCIGEECMTDDAAQTVDKQEHSAFDTDQLSKFHAAEKETIPPSRERQYDQYKQQRQRRREHRNKFLTEENTPYVLAAICLVYIMLHYFKQQKKRQLDEENSRRQLQKVRERNVILDKQKQRLKRLQNEGSKEVADEASELLKDIEVILSSDMERNDSKNDDDDDFDGIVNDTNQPQEQTNASNNSSPARDNDHISKIRAKQQKQLVSKTKISKRRERKEQLTRMQNSLDHRAADEAHERRMKLIAEEQQTLAQYHTNNQYRTYQGQPQALVRNEAEEAERIALLAEQNAAYQEALQRDQERAQQLALQRERKLGRAKAVEEAKQRLVTAGVQCNDYIMVQNHSNDTMGDSVIKVRLLLPSGRRVDAKFTDDHSIGLVYDLALLFLNEENLLWEKQEEEESHKVDTSSDADTDEDDKSDDGAEDISALYDGNDYNVIQEQWAELQLYPFAIVSTFPQKTYDNLSTTLTNCGLSKSAMLMVVVESD